MNSNYLDLISFGSKGIRVANYNKVREVLVNQFKAIYGSDIDLSSTSADGQWIEQQSLMINNMLQLIKQFYSNLDPREASGIYLDIISSYTNVIRRPATKSTAYVNIIGLEPEQQFTLASPLVLLDRNGDTWTCRPFKADSNGEATVLTVSDKFGPVRAQVGWIYTTVEHLPNVEITMTSDAIPGELRESDYQLRARRNNSLSMKGTTVIESIISNLLDVVGIEDVVIYNNDTPSNVTLKDGSIIKPNSIYVVIRRNENIAIDNSIIGSIIYEKKTPGIASTHLNEFNSDTGEIDNLNETISGIAKQYNYPTILPVDQLVNWKEAKPINSSVPIEIKITPRNYFVSGDSEESTSMIIAKEVIEYLNKIKLSDDVNHIELLSEVLYSDPLYRGQPTYSIVSVKIDGVEGNKVNPIAYFNYSNVAITTNGSDVVITIT